MSATFDLAEVGEAGVHNLDPTSGCSKDFAGERRKSHGNRDRRRRFAGRTGCGLSGLPVPPCGRGPSARQPVQRDVRMLSRVGLSAGLPSTNAREIL